MYTPMLKNHNGCHGNHAFFHGVIEFIVEDKILSISVVPMNYLAPHIYIEKLGYAGLYIFLIFAPKQIAKAVVMCTHNLCFEQK